MVTTDCQLATIWAERERRNGQRIGVNFRRRRVHRRRHDRGQCGFGIVTVKLGAFLDPLLDQGDLFRWEWVTLQRHAFAFIFRDNTAKQLAGIQLTRRDRNLIRITGLDQTLISINSVATLGLFRTVTGQAIVQQNLRDLLAKTNRLCRRRGNQAR